MLYERWRQIAQQRGAELALRDLGSDRHWTFAQLAQWAEQSPVSAAPMVCPQGHCPEFILAVLAAWRREAVVCPLEPHERPPVVPLPPKPCRHLKTTSATTGPSRFVAFEPEQLAADAHQIVATMGLRPDWPNLGVISLAHSYGFSNLVLPLLLHGIPLVLAPSPLPEVVRRAAQQVPALTLPGVPALWRAWLDAGAIGPSIRLAISAGAPLPVSLERAVLSESALKIHNFYGSSECGGIAYDATETERTEEVCVGNALPTVQLNLNEDGCLQVRSPAVGRTYWPAPEAALADGCFQTSDLAEMNEGRVYLRGRAGDQINIAGRKVSPATIEQALKAHPAVQECLVFGVPSRDRDRTDQIVACVVTKAPPRSAELKQFLLQTLPGWQIPREWWFVDSLETNQRGKISRTEWKRRFLERARTAGP